MEFEFFLSLIFPASVASPARIAMPLLNCFAFGSARMAIEFRAEFHMGMGTEHVLQTKRTACGHSKVSMSCRKISYESNINKPTRRSTKLGLVYEA